MSDDYEMHSLLLCLNYTTVNIFVRNPFYVVEDITMRYRVNGMEILVRERSGIIQTWFFVCA